MKGWSGVSKLGVVETIFEEEEEVSEEEEERVVEKCCESDDEDNLSSSAPPLSPPLSPISCPSSPDLEAIVNSWSLARRRRPDVKIHVQDRCFHLHKDVLSSKSAYLRRHLPEVTSLTLAPSLNLTSDTFSQIAEFCYTLRLTLTPFNLAALRTAAETLEMHTSDYISTTESLRHRTESYFSRSVSTNRDFASIVFKSCLKLLPEAEERACLASRCLEVMCEGEDSTGEEIRAVRPEEFVVIVESMGRRFTGSHDFLYEVIDLYLKVYDGKVSEDQKTQICNTIGCNMVSPELLMRAVQNHRMPLRFVVQAMLTEQLNTHRSICTTAVATRSIPNHSSSRAERPPNHKKVPTLGAILQQDAAHRQATQLKAAINTTMSRINCLEKELSTMKKRLVESERHRGIADGGRSASFRFSNESTVNKIERGERGSISSDNLRFRVNTVGSPAGRLGNNAETPRLKKSHLGQRLIRGLKSVFRGSKDSKVGGSSKEGEDYVYSEDDDVLFKEGQLCSTTERGLAEIVHSHNRTRSIS
ncbi:BTB/POZ domain-containing protein [Drosera capensis]